MAATMVSADLKPCKQCLKCHVIKFGSKVDLSSVVSVNHSHHGILFLQKKNGSTSILRLKDSGVIDVYEQKKKWSRVFCDGRSGVSGWSQTFFVQDENDSVAEYAITNDSVTLKKQLLIQPLQSAIETFCHCTVSTVKLAGYDKGHLLFLVNSDTLCAAELVDNVCVPCSWIPLPRDEVKLTPSGLSCCQVLSDVVAVLHQHAQLLFIYRFNDGELLCQLDLEPSGFFSSETQYNYCSWTMSPSLNRLIWFSPNRTVCVLNLDRYTINNPNVVVLSGTKQLSTIKQSVSQSVHTSQRGGISWIRTLQHLHQLETNLPGSSSWVCEKTATRAYFQKNQNSSGQTTAACSFRKKWWQAANATAESCTKIFHFPAGSLLDVGYKVESLHSAMYTIVLELASETDLSQRAVCLLDVKTQQVYFHGLPADHFPLTVTSMNLPAMILSPDGLLILLPSSEIQLDDIVSTMTVHSGSGTVDHLCQLNGWGHTTVPLHALELGLRQLQLNTVTFFLSSKEHVFTAVGKVRGDSSPWIPDTHLSEISDVIPAIDLFIKVISGSLPDLSPPHDFCLRLLALTLEFVHNLLEDGMVRMSQIKGTDDESLEKKDLAKALDTVLSYVTKLRDTIVIFDVRYKGMKQAGKQRTQSLRSEGSGMVNTEGLDSGSLEANDAGANSFIIPDTEVLNPEDFVDKACKEGSLPKLQSQLIAMGHEIVAQWGQVVQVGLRRAWLHIQQRDIMAAQTIISSLGLEVTRTIWQLAQYTTDRQLQEFVIEQLNNAAALTFEDRTLVDFLQKLYSLYPSTSVKQCLLHKEGNLIWTEHNPFASHLRKVQTNVGAEARDITAAVLHETFSESGHTAYCLMALHWLQHMDKQTQEAILLDGAILSSDESTDTRRFSTRLLWQYWLSRNEPQLAIEALEAALTAEKQEVDNCLTEYLSDLTLSASFVQHTIKCQLLRKSDRLWLTVASLDVPVEEKIGLMPGLFHAPHPALRFGARAAEQFHRLFAAYCVQHNFVCPLWKYCSIHGLNPEKLLEMESAHKAIWVKPFAQLYSAITNPDDSSKMFRASLSMASLVWQPEEFSLPHLLKMGHVTAAIATMAYMPETESIFEAGVDAGLLRTSLQRFPKLLSALLPPDADTSRFDINLYQLLKDNAPLDTRRLFGWQSTNDLTVGTEDAMKVLPYFSHPDLVSRYAYTARLDFTYYLKHGRPSYAFLSFLAGELSHKTDTLSAKRVHAACGMALWLAIKNFHNKQMSSACVAFVEMLGRDSIVLRSYIHAGETLLAHRVRSHPASADARREHSKASEQEVVSLLHSCLGRKREVCTGMLSQLEDAIVDEIAREGLSSTSVEAALKWNLAILLCHHAHLPLSTRFLETCAKEDLWLPFIWFAQLHQYPKLQLQQLLHQFPSRHLRDHLHYIIANTGSSTITPAGSGSKEGKAGGAGLEGKRSLRSSLYSRIGVQAASDGAGDVSSDEEKVNSQQSPGQPSEEGLDGVHACDELDVTEESAAPDVFRVIFSAMTTSEPWKSLLMHAVVLRNPLFGELAACCGAPVVSSLCGWMVAMLPPLEHARFVSNHGKRAFHWTMSHLEELIQVYLECHCENTLSAAFFIFQPTSPLLPFLQFISQCVYWRNFESCKLLLDKFKDDMAAAGSDKRISGGRDKLKHKDEQQLTDKPQQSMRTSTEVVGDIDWLEQTAYRVLQYELQHCPNLYDAVHMLQLLAEENMALVFSFDVLDFGHLHHMVEILHRHHITEVSLPRLFSAAPERQAYLQECQKALESLMALEVYEDSYKFGQCAGLDLSAVAFQQMSSEKQHLESLGIWASATLRHSYWGQCAARCTRFHLPVHQVAQFFQKEADATDLLSEKAAVFQLSLNHVEGHKAQLAQDVFVALRNKIFTQMWLSRIHERVAGCRKSATSSKKEQIEDIFSCVGETDAKLKKPVSREELLCVATRPDFDVDFSVELTPEESTELEKIMGELLSECRVSECCLLAHLLGGLSTELTVIQTCIGLSIGSVTVATMDVDSRRLLTTAEKRASLAAVASFTRGASNKSFASVAPDWSFLPPGQEEIIATMERLLCHCRQAKPCCLRIVTIYKISCLTGRSYKDVLLSEEFSVLRELLKTEYPLRYSLATEFLSTSGLTDAEVASFLVDEIMKSLRIYLGGKDSFAGLASKSGMTELIFRPTEGGEVFGQLVSLCGDPALLGDKLLHALAALADTRASHLTQSELSMVTELLIMSHECHTIACNMEGISDVLRATRICAQHLVEANQYQLMIRLLTGIGRYSEMTYIFDYLHQHHQFEMLLRKGIDKEDKLKTAILDYLKRFHMDDKDTYSMVALNFSMYREIAQMLEDSGHHSLNLLKDKSIESSKEMADTLKKSHQYFKDAAESYVKDQCYDYASQCLKWARLVHLQMQLLGSGLKVIHMTPEEIKAFVASHKKFIEAFIVMEAHGTAVDWSDSLFNHVVLGADMHYLRDFRSYLKLTPNLIESTLHKLKQCPGKVGSCAPQIRKLLRLCGDVWLEYKIAQDLGLQDFVKELLRDEFTGGYIKDMLSHP